jgi:hypothetical protein
MVLPYSMSKSFSSFLAQGLAFEESAKLDCLSFQPNTVKTKLAGDDFSGAITTEQAVSSCLRDLGTTSETCGHFTHELSMVLTPKALLQVVLGKIFESVFEKRKIKAM